MEDFKSPQSQSKKTAVNLFNDQLSDYLTKIGWNNPELQREFIALINSISLSAKDSASQRLMVTHLNKGLDLLNVQLQRVDLSKNNKIVDIDSEDVDTEKESVKLESVQPNLHQNTDIGIDEFKKLKEVLTKKLEEKGISNERIKEFIAIFFKPSGKTDKKLLYDLYNSRIDRLDEYIDSTLNEQEDSKESKKVTKKSEPTEKQKTKEQPKKEVEKSSVIINNFRTFFKNYLVNDLKWSDDMATSFIGIVISFIERFSNNPEKQILFNTKLNSFVSQSGGKDFNVESNDLTVAKSELQKYATKFNGWTQSSFDSYFGNINTLSKKYTSNKSVRVLIKKLSDLLKNLKK